MANLLSMPSISVGLMGRRNQPPVNDLSFLEQLMKQSQQAAQFDAGDAYFTNPGARPAGNGVPVLENGAVGYVPPTPGAAPAQRERVSGWRLLDRVLGGQTVTEGLDAERTRLQAQADAPQQRARIEAALGAITDPRERALFLGLGGEDWQKNVAQQFAPQVIGAGGIQSVIGNGQMVGAPSVGEFGDRVRVTDPITRQTTYSEARAPSYQEETARLNATNPVTVAQDARLVDPYTGNVIAQGLSRPDIQNIPQGGEAAVFDENGNIINRVSSTQSRPQSAGEIKRADDLELAVAQDQNSVDRVTAALSLITDPDGPEGPLKAPVSIGPWQNFGAGVLNRSGNANDNSRGIAQIKTTVEALRQGILNDATGPQTEGDALRALDSILAGLNDPTVIQQGFNDYLNAKKRTMGTRQAQIDRIRGGGAQAGSVARPTSEAEFNALPSGTLFMAPDGSTRRKP